MSKKEITVEIEGGVVIDAHITPDVDAMLRIVDYDSEGEDPEQIDEYEGREAIIQEWNLSN